MSNKMKKSYKSSTHFYDNVITHKTWWSKIYSKIIWKGADNNRIAKQLLNEIPNDFTGKLLDVPVGTAVFVSEKYNQLSHADITCLDYSEDMLHIAKQRINNPTIQFIQGNVEDLKYEDESFDIVFSMNGFHVFPNKDIAFKEVTRVLKKDGILLASFYIKGKGKLADFIAENILAKKGFVSTPFDDEQKVKERLSKNYELIFFESHGSLIYFCARKVKHNYE